MSKNLPAKNSSQIIIYYTEGGQTKIEVRLENETVWLTQKLMAELFQIAIPTINEHIKNIFREGELTPDATIRKSRIVQQEGNRDVSWEVDFLNLDTVIARQGEAEKAEFERSFITYK